MLKYERASKIERKVSDAKPNRTSRVLSGHHGSSRPVYTESRVCVVKGAVMCSFEY